MEFYQWLMVFVIQMTNVICDQSHFATPCRLCQCFAVYTDRAQTNLLRPYATASFYNTTESECLAACLRENGRCKGVVYGVVGDREVFTCELHQRIKLGRLIYAPYSNVYLKRRLKCAAPYEKVKPLKLRSAAFYKKPSFKRKRIGYHYISRI